MDGMLKSLSIIYLKWFKINKRDLPFRKDKDPYKVWLAEIILQQTQMDTGIRYYKRFIKTFPNIIKLSEASEENVYSMWKGLGYYNRAKNLHKTAKIITTNFKGIFICLCSLKNSVSSLIFPTNIGLFG